MKMYRHGDLLMVAVDRIPATCREIDRDILAEGEVTGHAHRIHGATVLEDGEDLTYLRITDEGAIVTHEEHGPLSLPPGYYRVVHQREYDPYEEAAWRVQD